MGFRTRFDALDKRKISDPSGFETKMQDSTIYVDRFLTQRS